MSIDIVVVEHSYNAPVEKIWAALTDIQLMKQWYFPQLENFVPTVGFETSFNVHHEGADFLHIWKVIIVDPPGTICYEWKYGGYPGNSHVRFDLTQHVDKTKLTITHSGLASFESDKHPALSAENFYAGWESFAGKLEDFLGSRGTVESI